MLSDNVEKDAGQANCPRNYWTSIVCDAYTSVSLSPAHCAEGSRRFTEIMDPLSYPFY